MSHQLAACGLVCRNCEAFQATQANDAEAIAAVAAAWSRRYQTAFVPDDIWCDGCAVDSERTNHHCRDCPIRPCARRRGFTTCAQCPDYRCDNLVRLHRLSPEAHQNLENLRCK